MPVHFKRWDALRLTAFSAIILTEGLVLGIAFDADSLTRLPHGWWSILLGQAGKVMPLAIVIVTSALLLATSRVRRALRSSSEQFPLRGSVLFLIVHLLAFGALFLLSVALFGTSPSVRRHPATWVTVWISCAALTGLFWLAALIPPRTILGLARRAKGPLLISVAIGLLAWAAGRYTQHGWDALRGFTLTSSYGILRLLDPTAYVDIRQSVIGCGRNGFSVEVNSQCSGYEGIGLVCIFLAGYFWVFRRELRFPHVLLLLPAAILAVWIANIFRIAALVAIGGHLSEDIALGGFHSYAGVLLFSSIALVNGRVAHRSTYFSRNASCRDELGRNPAAPWLVPFLATLLAGMITSLFAAGAIDRYYFVRVLAGAAVLWSYRREYPPFDRRILATPVFVGVLVFFLWFAVARYTPGTYSATPSVGSSWLGLWAIFRAAGSVIIMPIVEELAFRGYLARRLMSADFRAMKFMALSPLAIVLSSLAFAALHGHMVAGFIGGVAYCWVAKKRNRLSDAIIAHVVTNALFSAYVLATHQWSMW